MLGEITGGSIGTISYVNGDRVYGFGHPLAQFGSVQWPIIEARVLGEISNLEAPYKFASLNPHGSRHPDRGTGCQGFAASLGDGPELVPVRSVLALPSGAVELVHEIATGFDEGGLVPLVAFSPLVQRVDNEADHSLRVARRGLICGNGLRAGTAPASTPSRRPGFIPSSRKPTSI